VERAVIEAPVYPSLPAALAASEPPEARGLSRDGVRLLVGRRGTGEVSHHAFRDLPSLLREGDVVVVNTSATLPAAVPVVGADLAVHFSTAWWDGTWLVELRRVRDGATVPFSGALAGEEYELPGHASIRLLSPYSEGRLWVASTQVGLAVPEYLRRHGTPIRYGYVHKSWPLSYYQTVFGSEPGSAEMPSAGRPFTDAMVTRLVTSGVVVVPVLLHTGVASAEAHERPYPERFAVSAATAGTVNQRRADGGRIIAVGTTVVRALESAVGADGLVHARAGRTELVVTPERGVRVVDGLLTGLHEPAASHLDMLAAIAGRPLLDACYAEAAAHGYLWHEFGDVNLLLP
jgi:S-adenosylmethionine:tRNA ribosyltransferase-isomerase